MKFLRFGPPGGERPGVLDANGRIRDLSDMMSDIAGPSLARLGRVDPEALPRVEGAPRLGVPVAGVGKVICIGRNFADHAAGDGAERPAEPVVSLRTPPALSGPNDSVALPKGARRPGGAVGLGVVIGRTARSVREDEALAHVAGYAVFADLSIAAVPDRAGEPSNCGSGGGFVALGPWLVTPDEVGDPQRLSMELTVNGEIVQRGTTADMIFPVARIVSHLSGLMTLDPGDVVATGTTAGGGPGGTPHGHLGTGDVVEAWIEGLGRQRQALETA